jgi:hypothetical protein
MDNLSDPLHTNALPKKNTYPGTFLVVALLGEKDGGVVATQLGCLESGMEVGRADVSGWGEFQDKQTGLRGRYGVWGQRELDVGG